MATKQDKHIMKKGRSKCSWVIRWFLNMACQKWCMLCLKDQRFMITKQDKEIKIWEWNREFIVDVQRLAQHGKGKWWRSQPRWLVRGTKKLWWSDGLPCVQVLMWSASIRGVFEVSYPSLDWEKQCNASNILLEWLEYSRTALQNYLEL